MDLTEVHSQPRKSLARRVSFASHLHIRLIDGKQARDPQSSSPNPLARNDGDGDGDEDEDNDENKHPVHAASRRRSSMRRRSSVAFSEFGEQSMDMDDEDGSAPLPADFLNQNNYQLGGSAVQDDEFTDDEDEDDMEITEAIRLNIERKRSLSLGGPARASLPARRRSSIAPTTVTQGRSENQPPPPQHNGDLSEVREEGDTSVSSATGQSFASEGSSMEETQPIEYTAPVGKSLRPKKRPSAAWLALQAVTHAGIPSDNEDENEDEEGDSGVYQESEPMELTDAMSRIMKARASLGMSPGARNANTTVSDMDMDEESAPAMQESSFQDDSFTSTEDSFGGDVGDRTVNMTTLVRSSLGTQDSLLDTAPPGGVTDEDRPIKLPLNATPASAPAPPVTTHLNATAAPKPVPSPQPPAPEQPATTTPAAPSLVSSVFSASTSRPPVFAPPPKTPVAPTPRSPGKPPPSATIPKPSTFSLSRTPARPPTLASPAPAPKVPAATTNAASTTTSAPAAPRSPAVQRPSAAFAPPTARKSPMKRSAPPASEAAHPPSPAKRAAVGRLEPAKIAPFERARAASQEPVGQGARRASMVRRPSGYFAQRKSLGAGVLPPLAGGAGAKGTGTVGGTGRAGGSGLGRARASVGTAPSSIDLGLFGGKEANGGGLYPDVSRIAEEDPPTPTPTRDRANSAPPDSPSRCEREEMRQAIAAPSPTRGSPAPGSPRSGSPDLFGRQASPAARRASPAIPSPRPASPAVPSPKPTPPVQVAPPVEAGLRDTGITLARPSGTQPPVESAVTEQWLAGVEGEDDDEGVSRSRHLQVGVLCTANAYASDSPQSASSSSST